MAAAWWVLILTIGLAAAGERRAPDLAYWHQPYLRPAALNRLVAVQALNEDGRLVTGQSKPWFEPQVEDDYVHQEQPLQPVQIVDANGRPIGLSKPWFAPAIEEQQGLRQIAPFLVSLLIINRYFLFVFFFYCGIWFYLTTGDWL